MSIKDVANNIAKTVIDNANKGVMAYFTSKTTNEVTDNKWSLFPSKSQPKVEKTVVTTDGYTKVMTLLNSWFIKYPMILLCTYIIILMIIEYAKSVIEMIV